MSKRARRVRLVMRPKGLEVVLPEGYGRRGVPELIEQNLDWIEKASRRVAEQRQRSAEEAVRLPDEVVLPALGEVWTVVYQRSSGDGGRVRADVSGGQVVVSGNPEEFESCKQALCRWLSRRARSELPTMLDSLSQRHGLGYARVTIRQQRTRWGSCSRSGNISLNAKLLLLPREACEYVLLHELCHTVVMDHSPRFWALVEECDADYKAHKKLVRESGRVMPPWLDREPGEEAM